MNLTAIFQVLEHFNDFEKIGYGGHCVFYNKAKTVLRPNICRLGLLMHFSAPVIRGTEGRFSVMTPFNLEAGVKGQIQHLETIPRP